MSSRPTTKPSATGSTSAAPLSPEGPGSSHAAFRALRTFPSLDGLRAFSILAVMFHHAHGSISLGRFGDRGFLGVDMFFVLSGFLIVTLLLRERDKHGGISLRNFYVRRSLRIMPVYYGLLSGLTLVFTVVAPASQAGAAFLRELPYHLTYTSNWVATASILSITWSLSAEEQFYLVWPPIEKLVPRPIFVLAVFLVLSQLVHFGVLDGILLSWFGQGPSDLTMLRQTTFTPILLGVSLAHLLHDARGFAWFSRVCGPRGSALGFALALCVCFALFPEDLCGWPRLVIHLLMMLLLASAVVRSDHSLAPLLHAPALVRVGVLSYGMYLLHMLAVHAATVVLSRAHASMALLFPLTLAFTWMISELSYRFYETRFLRLKERFQR